MRNLPTASPAATAFPLFRAPHPLAVKAIIAGALILLVSAGPPATKAWADVLQTVPHPTGEALRHPDPVVHAYFQRSVELVFREKHAQCLETLDRFARSHPAHPAPDFLKAACYQSWMNTFRTNRFTHRMDGHVDAAIAKGLALLEGADDPWLHLCVGAAYGFRALNRFRRHAWIDALVNMNRSLGHLRASLAAAPNLYDAYMGIGVYNYWRTARSHFIRRLAFWMTDRREIGLAQLRVVLTNGVYARHETSYNLIAAYIDAGRFDAALDLVEENITRKGGAQSIDLYYKGRILMEMERWRQAATVHQALLAVLDDSGMVVAGYRADVCYRIALSLFNQQRYPEARRFATAALVHCAQRRPEEEIESSFESFQEVHHRLEQLHQRLTAVTAGDASGS